MKADKYNPSPSGNKPVSIPTSYPQHQGNEHFEHDDTGAEHNRGGVVDEITSALAEDRDWQEGYDY